MNPVKRGMRSVFEIFAGFYGWLTAQGAWRAACAELAERLPPNPRLIVDLGCGPGVSTFELARRVPNARLVGVDLARRMLDQAVARTKDSGVDPARLTWLRADVGRLPFKDATVDAFTGHSFLYLLPDQPLALAEMFRCLKPGGRIVMMEPNAKSVPARDVIAKSKDFRFLLSMVLWRRASWAHGRFTPTTLASAFESAGFTGVRVDEALAGLGLFGLGIKS